jgi:hypothetical protein
MTTTTSAARRHETTDHRLTSAAAGLLSFAVASYFIATNAHDNGEIYFSVGLAAVVAVVLFGWLVPTRMAAGAPATALTLGVLAALLVLPAFWSGLPLLLGVAGLLVGRASSGKRAVAAIVLSAIATIVYLYLYVVVGLVQDKL